MQIEFDKPRFEIGEYVWMVCAPNHSALVEIRNFNALIYQDRFGKCLAHAVSAKINSYIIDGWFDDIDHDTVPFKYMTKDEEEAKRWMKPWTVDLTDGEWFKTIGKRPTFEELHKSAVEKTFDSEDSLEESELGSCCSTLSDIRDIFITCRDKGQITGWERELLQKLLNGNHDKHKDTPLLDRVLEQLDATWKE